MSTPPVWFQIVGPIAFSTAVTIGLFWQPRWMHRLFTRIVDVFKAMGHRRSVLTIALVFQALIAEMVALPMPARADESSYLADLAAHNIPVLIPASAVSDGFRVCGQIRAGMSPATVAQTFGPYYNVVGPQIVDIARHDLCPDTLH